MQGLKVEGTATGRFPPRDIKPYVEVPLTAEEQQSVRDNRERHRMTAYTEEQEAIAFARTARIKAERQWLTDNLPVGSVFMHMGVPVMVMSTDGPSGMSQPRLIVKAHCRGGNGGITELTLDVPQLLAILAQERASNGYSYEEIPDATASSGVHYRVHDAADNRVATCYLRENAERIVEALNGGAA